MSRMVSFVVLVAIVALLGVMFYRVMVGFVLPLFLAALLVVMFRPLHRWILVKCKGRERIAAGATTLAILLIVLLPAAWVFAVAVLEGVSLLTGYSGENVAGQEHEDLQTKLEKLRERFDLEMPLAAELAEIEPRVTHLSQLKAADGNRNRQAITTLRGRVETLRDVLAKGAVDGVAAEDAAAAEISARIIVGELTGLLREAKKGAEGEPPGPSEFPKPPPDDVELQYAARKVKLSFIQLKQQLAGGPIWLWVKELVNPSTDKLQAWREELLGRAQGWLLWITGATTTFVTETVLTFFILTVALYFFLADGPRMFSTLMRLSPLDDQYELQLLGEFDSISRAVVIATLLSAFAQGLLAGAGYLFAGIQSVFLLTLLTMVLALIPVLGAAIVWVPTCFWLFFFEERSLAAILLAIYCVIVVSTVDNLIKPWVLQGRSKLHPLLGLLSVLGGAKALGPIGILVGPMVVSFLQAVLNMLHTELHRMQPRTAVETAAATEAATEAKPEAKPEPPAKG